MLGCPGQPSLVGLRGPTEYQFLRVVAIALYTIVAGSVGYAFAASNSGLAGPGGDGAGEISGYSVANVSYTFNARDPARIDAISFDLGSAAASSVPDTVKVSLIRGSDTWHDCQVIVASAVVRANCVLAVPVRVADVDDVRVVAAQ